LVEHLLCKQGVIGSNPFASMFPCRGAEQESPPAAMSGPILWIGRCALGGVSPAKAGGACFQNHPAVPGLRAPSDAGCSMKCVSGIGK
jgi:hypothetical protein